MLDPIVTPTDEEAMLARTSSRALAHHLGGEFQNQVIRVVANGEEETIILPAAAFRMLLNILGHMAEGHGISMIPINAKLSSQEAADLLNVSRPHLVKLLGEGAIPHHKVGTHRRILAADVLSYKHRIDAERIKVLDHMVSEAEEMGLYD